MPEHPNQQSYYDLVQELLTCETNEQLTEVVQASDALFIPTLQDVLEQKIQDAQQEANQPLVEKLNSLNSWLFNILCQKTIVRFLEVTPTRIEHFIDGHGKYLFTETAFESAHNLQDQYATQPEMVSLISSRLHAILNRLKFIINILRSNPNAIDLYEERLIEVIKLSKRQAPYSWAAYQGELGDLYLNKQQGNRAAYLLAAINCFKGVLQIYTKQSHPQFWAMAQNNLGNAYRELMTGDISINLEHALICYKLALQVRTQENYPVEWAVSLNNLGNVYRERIREDRAQNLDEAITCYERALEVFTQYYIYEEMHITLSNLGNAYSERIKGDEVKNREDGIIFYKRALKILAQHKQTLKIQNQQKFEISLASTQQNLAKAYVERLKGNRAKNLKNAIKYFKKALKIFTKRDFTFFWASTQNNLGNAYRERTKGNIARNLEKAIACFERAIEVFTEQHFPFDWAMAQNNLGLAYKRRIEGNRADNLENAIAYFQQALKIQTQQESPLLWAKTQTNLGLAYQKQVEEDITQDLESAITCYKLALGVFTPQAFPTYCQRVARNLGKLFFEQKRWEESRNFLETAHLAIENLRGQVQRQEARKKLAQENTPMYQKLVYVCLLQQDVPAAIRYASAAKARSLSDRLNAGTNHLEKLLENDLLLAAKWQPVNQLRQELDKFTAQLYKSPLYKGAENTEMATIKWQAVTQQMVQKRQELKAQLDKLFFQFPILSATEAVPILDPQDAMQLSADLGGIPFVEYYQHAYSWVAFIVTPQDIQCVKLAPNLIDTASQMEHWIFAMESGVGDAFNLIEVKQLLINLYQALIAPLQHLIPKNGPLVIAPASWMHLMPFQIAYNANHERYLMDDYTLTFTPSLAALRAQYLQIKNTGNSSPTGINIQNLLSVVYSANDTDSPLPNVLLEAEALARYFAPVPDSMSLHEMEATPDQVVQVCRQQAFEVIHFGCHGSFDFNQPDNSGLLLADSRLLTVERVRTEIRLKEYPLVTLGACQSGRTFNETGDEAIGLNLSFLAAGAKAVVSSLWSVPDEATKILFEAFYQERRNNLNSEAEALRQAMFRVRARLKWKHPFFWAAFHVTGLPISATDF